MNKIWFFGDTYTLGYGCNIGDPYYEQYPDIRSKKWTTIVSETLDLIEMNMGESGLCNENIIIKILEQKQNFDSNDIVVIGVTDSIKSFLVRASDKKFSEVFFDPNLPTDYWINNGTFNNYEEQIIHKQYFDKFKYPYQDEWLDFHMKIINFIRINLNTRVYVWDSKVISKMFETIEKNTNNKIKSVHFSWGGHLEMSKWMLNKINNE